MSRSLASFALLMLVVLTLGLPLGAAGQASPVPEADAYGSGDQLSAALPAVPYNSRFGLAWISGPEMSQVPESRYQKALASGARWNRWVMYWVDHERNPNSIDWATWDANVIRDHNHGLNVLALLQQTPDWAVNAATGQTDFETLRRYLRPGLKLEETASAQDVIGLDTRPPRNLDKPVFLPDGRINPENYWGYFVYRTVNRYKPGGDLARQQGWGDGWGIRHWEIWNEPNLSMFWGGSVAQYYLLLKVAYQAAKAADPNAFILWGGIAHAGNTISWSIALMDEIARDGNRTSQWPYFDATNWHWYSQAAALYDQSRLVQSELSRRGLGGKQMWVTETNVPAYGDPGAPSHPSCVGYPYSANTDEQASYVIQAYANAMAAGVDRVFVHQLQDDQWGAPYPEAWGLVRNDESLRPLYAAYQVAAKYFANPQQVTKVIDNASVARVTMSGVLLDGHYHRVTVLWNLTGNQVTASVAAVAASAQRIRKDGSSDTVAASGGRYQVWLGPATARVDCTNPSSGFIIGGDPRILVEDTPTPGVDITPPTATVDPLPGLVDQVFTVSWSGSDGPNGSGVKSFDVQFQDITAGTGWQDWLLNTTATSARFLGTPRHSYGFRCRATDNAGNVGTYPASAQAQTTVRYVPPPTGLIVNGGFEGSGDGHGLLSGWTVGGSVSPMAATLPHTGSYAVLLGGLGGQQSGSSVVYQRFRLPANSSHTYLSFCVLQVSQPTASAWFEAKVEYLEGGKPVSAWVVPPTQSWLGSGWRQVSIDLADAGDSHADLRGKDVTLYLTAVGGCQTYVDDVEMWPQKLWFPLMGS